MAKSEVSLEYASMLLVIFAAAKVKKKLRTEN